MLTPNASDDTYLLDIHGRQVQAWEDAPYPGKRGAYLGEDGRLYSSGTVAEPAQRGGGFTGALFIQNWDGEVEWQFEYATDDYTLHHDLEVLPNGNILAFAWTRHSAEQMISLGRDPDNIPDGEMWGERIMELQPIGTDAAEIVWEWNLIDHLIQDFDPNLPNYGAIADHPEKLDVNVGGSRADWIHLNTIDYNAQLDQIVVSSPALDEIWIIDHSTTTAEAATGTGGLYGKGGDFLYRWGNPGNYGVPGEQQLFNQHDIQWIDADNPGAGNLLVFNNQTTPNSQVFELVPPLNEQGGYQLQPNAAFGPAEPIWIGDIGARANFISGTQRLPNGNTLYVHGPDGIIGELTPAGEEVWRYVNPVTSDEHYPQGFESPNDNVFQARRYLSEYPGLAGQDLTPKGFVEYWISGDYDLDGRITESDAAILESLASSGDMLFDLNYDNAVDQLDTAAMSDLVELWVQAPTQLLLSETTVIPVSPADTTVGKFSTESSAAGETYTYQLVVGEESSGNNRFRIEGDELVINEPLDFQQRNSYSARVRTTDSMGRSLERSFQITVRQSPWHNANNPTDVNQDNVTAPIDALAVINEFTDRTFSDPITGHLASPLTPPVDLIDVTGDWIISPIDALLVINALPSNAITDLPPNNPPASSPAEQRLAATRQVPVQLTRQESYFPDDDEEEETSTLFEIM